MCLLDDSCVVFASLPHIDPATLQAGEGRGGEGRGGGGEVTRRGLITEWAFIRTMTLKGMHKMTIVPTPPISVHNNYYNNVTVGTYEL